MNLAVKFAYKMLNDIRSGKLTEHILTIVLKAIVSCIYTVPIHIDRYNPYICTVIVVYSHGNGSQEPPRCYKYIFTSMFHKDMEVS